MKRMDIVAEDLQYFIDRALDGMIAIVEELGDDMANRAPDLPGANSPFVILTHCVGVMAYWGGQIMNGRDVQRDRPAEFTASGSVESLVAKVAAAREAFRADLLSVALDDDARIQLDHPYGPERTALKASTAAVHILEELAQHHGQMEITRDLLSSNPSTPK